MNLITVHCRFFILLKKCFKFTHSILISSYYIHMIWRYSVLTYLLYVNWTSYTFLYYGRVLNVNKKASYNFYLNLFIFILILVLVFRYRSFMVVRSALAHQVLILVIILLLLAMSFWLRLTTDCLHLAF